jgi:hypothetical protein
LLQAVVVGLVGRLVLLVEDQVVEVVIGIAPPGVRVLLDKVMQGRLGLVVAMDGRQALEEVLVLLVFKVYTEVVEIMVDQELVVQE